VDSLPTPAPVAQPAAVAFHAVNRVRAGFIHPISITSPAQAEHMLHSGATAVLVQHARIIIADAGNSCCMFVGR
jgi:hypothetical protein